MTSAGLQHLSNLELRQLDDSRIHPESYKLAVSDVAWYGHASCAVMTHVRKCIMTHCIECIVVDLRDVACVRAERVWSSQVTGHKHTFH